MKHLRRFTENVYHDLAQDIAKDLLPQLEKMRKSGELVTPEFFEKFMKERGSNLEYVDAVMSELVSMGFDFDSEYEETSEEEFDVRYIESISYSGGDVTKMPVIGKVVTKPIGPYDSGEYNVVEIIKVQGVDVYVCDFWYKEWKRIPQLIHSELVERFIDN